MIIPNSITLMLAFGSVSSLVAGADQPPWDWKSPETFRAYCSPHHSGTVELQLNSPFYTPGSPVFRTSPAHMDMWEADGWMLVQKNLGTPEKAPEYPSFVLYNKYRGILRVFFFVPYDLGTTHYAGQLKMLSDSPQGSSPLFTFSSYPRCFATDYDPDAIQEFLDTGCTKNNWLTCDFVISGYDPQLRDKRIKFEFKVHSVNITQIKTSGMGTFETDQAFDSHSIANHFDASNHFGRTLEALQSGYNIYKSDRMAMEAVRQGNHGADASWVASAIAGATGISALGPLASGLAGALTAFLGGGSGQSTPMNFRGSFKFTTQGALIHSRPCWTEIIDLEPASLLMPGSGTPFGVCNLVEKPRILDNIEKEGSRYRHTISYLTPPSVVMNPNIYYGSSELGVAFTFNGSRPGVRDEHNDYFPLTLGTCSFVSDSRDLPSGLALKLKATLPGPSVLATAPVEIIKVYPVEARPRLEAGLSCQEVRLNNRERESGLLRRCIIRTNVEDPYGGTGYRHTWNLHGLAPYSGGMKRLAGGGPADGFVEVSINKPGNYLFEVAVHDDQGNVANTSYRLNVPLHDR